MTKILDITLAIRRKRMSTCAHDRVEVDEEVASLTCAECENELDPWWWIRRLAERGEQVIAEQNAARQQYAAWVTSANEKLARLTKEINDLIAKKNKLWNERIDGVPLGAIKTRRRKAESR